MSFVHTSRNEAGNCESICLFIILPLVVAPRSLPPGFAICVHAYKCFNRLVRLPLHTSNVYFTTSVSRVRAPTWIDNEGLEEPATTWNGLVHPSSALPTHSLT